MTVYSVSPFFNELDVLEIRLATLDPLVDRFVIAEATVDQRGQAKPLHLPFALDTGRYDQWRSKITYVIVDNMPTGPDHWEREHFQRNELIRGMPDLQDDDLVLICDLDEIPYPEALEEALESPGMRLPMDMFVYRLNWRWTERPVRDGSTAVVYHGYDFWDPKTGHERDVHDVLLGLPSTWRVDHNDLATSSGWHLAYMGSDEMIARKTTAIADNAWSQLISEEAKKEHPDPAFWTSVEWASHCALTGTDIYGRRMRQAEWVDTDQMPPYVWENAERFEHLLVEQPR